MHLARGSARILRAAEDLFGDQPPAAIVLTHGHFDHRSSARQLAEHWDVPVYAHRRSWEMPSYFFTAFVKERRLGVVLVAPFDIRLPERIADPVEPDVLFIRREHQPRAGDLRFDGVPDLAIEVLSPGNWRFDRNTKLPAYRDAGTPETWLVDPIARTVEVYALDPKRAEYALRERREEGETVSSAILPGLRITVAELFPSADS
ncbi:MAG TPA: Uma2 family endonuclease [Thermoanaerobaculia bacterium]|nr:Uma2 family endonuclease [Thermoanaerobaculia bacterium]